MRLLMKLLPLAIMGFIGYTGYEQILSTADYAINFSKINVTQHEIASFLNIIAVEVHSGSDYPADFRDFLTTHFEKPAGSFKEVWQDVWLQDYRYDGRKSGCMIASNGPDTTAGTRDDIKGRFGRY